MYYYYKHNSTLSRHYFELSKTYKGSETLLFYNDNYLAKLEVDANNEAKALSLLKPYANYGYSSKENIQLNKNISNYYKLLSEVEEKLGNESNALKYIKQYNAIKDSINVLSVSNNVNSAKINFELNKQKEEYALQYNYEKQLLAEQYAFTSKKIWYIIVIVISISVILVLVAIFYIITKRNIAKNKANEAKYNLLKAQLNPHFVSNAMSSIQGYILTNDKIIASNYLSDFSKLTRLIFEKSSQDFIALEDEVTILKLFFELQILRFPDQFNYQIITTGIVTDNILIPPMLIQPIIENAIEHNTWQSKKGLIVVRFELVDKDYLLITVSDNGQGLFDDSKVNHKGSLSIIEERIKVLNDTENKKGYMLFENGKDEGLNVSIKTPYKNYE